MEGLNEFQCKGFDDVLAFMKVGNKVVPFFRCYVWVLWTEIDGRFELRLRR